MNTRSQSGASNTVSRPSAADSALCFRPAAQGDHGQLVRLLNEARSFLRDSGVDQWQGSYPNEETLRADIADGNGWVLTLNGEICAYFYIAYQMEEYQRHIDGAWKTNLPCASIHRLMVDNRLKGRGLGALCLSHAESLCRERGIDSIKTDTDKDNLPMQRVLEKMGYVYCGTVTFDSSSKIAFEKVLE